MFSKIASGCRRHCFECFVGINSARAVFGVPTWSIEVVGGGANVKINDAVAARVGGDYIRIKGKDQSELITDALQGLRITAGVSVGFGGK